MVSPAAANLGSLLVCPTAIEVPRALYGGPHPSLFTPLHTISLSPFLPLLFPLLFLTLPLPFFYPYSLFYLAFPNRLHSITLPSLHPVVVLIPPFSSLLFFFLYFLFSLIPFSCLSLRPYNLYITLLTSPFFLPTKRQLEIFSSSFLLFLLISFHSFITY